VERARAQARAALENVRDVAESLGSARRTPKPSERPPRERSASKKTPETFSGFSSPRDENAPPPPNGVA
jgi:hypothetical protein